MDELIVVIVLILFLLIRSCNLEYFSTRKCNSMDGRCYRVSTLYKPETMTQASERLAKMNKVALKLIRHMRDTYLWNNNNPTMRYLAINLLKNYNPESLKENVPYSSSNTSYVKNKGEEFGVCLRDKYGGSDKFVDENTLRFVVIHELSHLASSTYGHNAEFWTNFRRLLREAVYINIYKPVDYSKYPVNYCSLHITYNPLFG